MKYLIAVLPAHNFGYQTSDDAQVMYTNFLGFTLYHSIVIPSLKIQETRSYIRDADDGTTIMIKSVFDLANHEVTTTYEPQCFNYPISAELWT